MEHQSLKALEQQYASRNYDVNQLEQMLAEAIKNSTKKFVVLDDDPTGVQTVHDITVFTDWSVESIKKGFALEDRIFYVLTNSRGLTADQTTALHKEIAANIMEASKQVKQDFAVISRSDSTLRGHFPLETSLLKECLEAGGQPKIDGEVLFPFFKEGGRYTVQDVHYVAYGDELVPAGDTEFAKDQTFGYASSNLCEYVEEKTNGAFRAKDVTRISLYSLRGGEVNVIKHQLLEVTDFHKVIVNALDYEDVKVFCTALYQAMAEGKNFLFRTAASFIKVLGGVTDIPLLTRKEMVQEQSGHGGIVVIGSHTQKTTQQMEELKQVSGLEFIEFNSDLVLEDRLDEEVVRVNRQSEELISKGKTVVVYTKRKLLVMEHDTKEQALLRSVKISDAVQALVGNLNVKPAFVIAKGGITSSDVGVKALQVKQALVLGQIRFGIPVWKTDAGSRFPGIPYVIFPGNVGTKDALREAVEILLEK